MKTYSLASIAVIRVDAGNDRNGNPRRGYMLVDSTTGCTIAYADEGYDGSRCLLHLVRAQLRTELNLSETVDTLYRRRTDRIRIAPSYRTHLLRNEASERAKASICGKPLLTA